MVNFFIAFLGVFFSGQQASVLFGFTGSMTKATSAANYIFWLSELQPTIRETPENYDIGPCDFSSLALEKLQFSYPLRPHARVLRGINLHVSFPSSLSSHSLMAWWDAIDTRNTDRKRAVRRVCGCIRLWKEHDDWNP